MKRIFALLLAAVMLLSLAACGEAADPTEAPTEAPTVPAEPLDLQALYETMLTEMPAMMPMSEDMMLNYCGIFPEDCAQAVAAICQDGMRADEIWLIEAASEESLVKLKATAESRLKAKGEETVSYSPEQYKVVEKGQILTDGLYLVLIVTPEVDAVVEIFREAIGG